MKFTVEGSAHPVTLRLFRNGVEVLNYTTADASGVKTGGSPGIGMFSFQNLLLDDWQGGNLGGWGFGYLTRRRRVRGERLWRWH